MPLAIQDPLGGSSAEREIKGYDPGIGAVAGPICW